MSKGFILSDEVLNHEINDPAYKEKYNFNPSDQLNDLDLFTKGQPFSLYKISEKTLLFFIMSPCPQTQSQGTGF